MLEASGSHIVRAVSTLIAACLVAFPSNAQYGGGTGEPNDPYQIATAADLIGLGETPEDYDKHFILTADIDLDPNLPGGRVFDRAVIAPDVNDMEYWFQGTPFTGVFDGAGHTISHLTIPGGSFLGLFGRLEERDSYIWSYRVESGGVKNLGMVDVVIMGSGGHIGGLVGDNSGSISACYTKGLVSGMNEVGGLVGSNFGTIVACYSTASVISDNGAGGLVCGNLGTVIECYSIGAVTGSWLGGGLIRYSGAPVPGAVGFVTTSFWDIQASGQGTSGGGTGKTTAEMHTATTFIGWGAGPSYWTIDEGRDYPHLAWENVPGDVIAGPAYGGGTGTPGDPYLICTPEQLNMIGLVPCDLDKHFKLMADIDLSSFDGKEGRPAFNMLSSGRGEWGARALFFFLGIPFTGSFDGNGHTISHLTIVGSDYVGLFGCLGSTAKVRNLGLEAVDISGTGYMVGALAGANNGTVSNCYSTGSVSGDLVVGGLVGVNESVVVTGCYSSASVSGNEAVGGLVGYNAMSIVTSRSSGSVSGDNEVGGLVGANNGAIVSSYNTASVSGSSSVGGLVGKHSYGTIVASYSTGVVSGSEEIGGLVGDDYEGSVSSSFWDTQTSGQTESAGGTGKTTAEMQDAETFLDVGWDFVDEALNGTCDYWQISPGEYPQLRYQAGNRPVMPEGLGTTEQPYLIRDALDLGTVWSEPLAHYRLTQSIDLSGIAWSMGVIPWFGGNLDGNGHVISHLTITGKDYLGLLGWLDGEVKNLGVADVNISGSADCVGGLVGHLSDGAVTQCYSSGSISGTFKVGGLVGWNEGRIADCYSTASVSGTCCVGGLVGEVGYEYRSGTVTDCYSTGAVSSSDWDVGGLVGYKYSGIITASLWDIETSGQSKSDGGTGKTTAEMQMAQTFQNAGWDFVGETANGTEDIWKIAEGLDYPRLWWEPYDGRVTVVLGQIFTVTLESNPSTGYRWEWVDHQDSIVEQMGEAQFKPRETGDPPLVGAGGWESFDFKAVHPGQMTLQLVYRRPWEEGVEPLKTFSLQVTVP